MEEPMSRSSVAPGGVDPTVLATPWRDGPSEVRDGTAARGDARLVPLEGRPAIGPMAAWFAPIDPERRVEVRSPEDAAAILLPAFSGADRERCVSALLDTKHRLLRLALVSVGSVDHTFMAPREIFRDALLANATAIVVAHNHPSGDAEPSRDDAAVTRRLARAGELIGVSLLDHLVIGAGRWVSLARRGALEAVAA
jgi:DNA repair protein RadC